jgi:hypothetical protein
MVFGSVSAACDRFALVNVHVLQQYGTHRMRHRSILGSYWFSPNVRETLALVLLTHIFASWWHNQAKVASIRRHRQSVAIS